MPTEPTQIQQLLNNLASLDIKSIETNLNALLTKLDTDRRTACTWRKSTQGVTNLLVSVDRLVSSPEITNDLAAVRPTLDQYRLLGEKLNSRVDPLADSITNTLAEANRTLAQFRGAARKPADHARARLAVAQRPRPGPATTRRRRAIHCPHSLTS